MSDFEYLSVLIAIIVGIAFAHLLLSLGRVLGEIRELQVSPVQLVWTANILLMMIAFWWRLADTKYLTDCVQQSSPKATRHKKWALCPFFTSVLRNIFLTMATMAPQLEEL